MKKTLLFFLSLTSLLAFTMSSCQKETVVTTTFEATMEECEDDDGKVAFTNGTMQWVTGDQIKVFGATGSGVYQATVQSTGRATFHCVEGDAGEAPYRAVYPASAANDDGTVELPVVQVTEDGSLTGFPMYAQGSSTNLNFKNLCGVLRMRLQKSGVSITSIEVTGDIELTGDYNVIYSSGVPTLEYSGHGTKTTMMTCNTPQSIANQKDFYIFLPVHTFSEGMRIRIYSSDGGVCTKIVSAGNSVRIQRAKITTITLRDNSLTFALPGDGALKGLFSINENGDQVRFSQGNLQYCASTNIWRFAEHQYDIIGYNNNNISSTYSGWIDLFGWGTSGWDNGNHFYMPYCTDVVNQCEVGYGYGPTDGYNYEYDLTGDYQEADWAWHNAIQNGGNTAHQWRTLERNEWNYLFHSRINASIKYGVGNIEGVGGIIVLPDNWIHPEDVPTFNPGLSPIMDDWSRNTYNAEQWIQMESAGALFLSAAGYRYGIHASDVNRYGFYWLSSHYSFSGAYAVAFGSFTLGDSGEHYIGEENDGYWGFSVRPVLDIN